jgi:hypothetical protein
MTEARDPAEIPSQMSMEAWVRTWQEVGPELEAIRRKEVREADNLHVLELLEEAFNHALRTLPCRPSSGMVQMQKYFAKLPR